MSGRPQIPNAKPAALVYAERELARTDYTPEIKDVVLNVIAMIVWSLSEHLTQIQALQVAWDLIRVRNLTPLTDDPGEWAVVSYDRWQSVRNPHAWSFDGGKTFWFDNHTVVPRVYFHSVPSGNRPC